MAVQEFNPETVLLSQSKEGELYKPFNDIIMGDVANSSAVMQLGRYEEMTGQEKEFTVLTDGVSAYWVNETEKIQTDKPELIRVTMRAHKLGIILLSSREALNYTWSQYFNQMRPEIVRAFRKKIDEAAILGVDSPYQNSVDQAAIESGNVVEGNINYENVLAVQDELYEHDVEPNAFVSKTQNNTLLRQARDEFGNGVYDKGSNQIDGIQAVNFRSGNMPKGTLYAGDFNNLVYGVPYNISYKVSEEGTISTVSNEDGSPINLFEQEMIALRATMDVATMVSKDEAFSKLQPAGAEAPAGE